jgi:hypothetical protein
MTTGIKFVYTFCLGEYNFDNPGSNVVSVTSQAAGDHDKKNLTTTPLRETWRSTGVSTWQEIVIQANDLTVRPDTFAILNHNLSSQAIVQLQGSMTTSFTGASTVTFVWSKKHMVLMQDLGAAYNYYRFRILDTTNACGFIEIGRILAGLSFTFTNNEDITDDISIQPKDLAYKIPTEGFFRAFNQRVKIDTLQVKFSKLSTTVGSDTNYQGLLAMLEVVGETFPFLTILDPSDQAFQIMWGCIENLPGRMYTVNRYTDMSLTITEVY